jgi:hypothetical protein
MHGLYLLWWVQEKQMSPALVATTLAAGDLVLMAIEVPTGWFADHFGHRASLMIGSFLQVLGMLCCWLGKGFSGLVAASLLVAAGDAFRSGADQALLYRSCAELDCEHAFQRIEARARASQLIALVLLVLAGGAIVERWGFETGWAAETALCFIGLMIAWAMVEPRSATDLDRRHPSQSDSPNVIEVSDTQRSPSTRGTKWRLALTIAPAAFLGGAASVSSFLAQTSGHRDPASVTVLVALIASAEAAGAAIAMALPAAGARGQALLAGVGLISIGVAVVFPPAILTVVVGLAFLMGIAQPLRMAAIQRLATDRVRASAASIASACDMAVTTIALPLAGWWRRAR